MRKLALCALFLLGCTVLPGCASRTPVAPPANQKVDVKGIGLTEVQSGTRSYTVDVIEFNGHRILFVRHGLGDNSSGGPMHDPDCPCRKKQQ